MANLPILLALLGSLVSRPHWAQPFEEGYPLRSGIDGPSVSDLKAGSKWNRKKRYAYPCCAPAGNFLAATSPSCEKSNMPDYV